MENLLKKFFLKKDEQEMDGEEGLNLIKMRIRLTAKSGQFDMRNLREAIKDVFGDEFDEEIAKHNAYDIPVGPMELDYDTLKEIRKQGLFRHWAIKEPEPKKVDIGELLPKITEKYEGPKHLRGEITWRPEGSKLGYKPKRFTKNK